MVQSSGLDRRQHDAGSFQGFHGSVSRCRIHNRSVPCIRHLVDRDAYSRIPSQIEDQRYSIPLDQYYMRTHHHGLRREALRELHKTSAGNVLNQSTLKAA